MTIDWLYWGQHLRSKQTYKVWSDDTVALASEVRDDIGPAEGPERLTVEEEEDVGGGLVAFIEVVHSREFVECEVVGFEVVA